MRSPQMKQGPRRSSMISQVPLKFSPSVVVGIGNDNNECTNAQLILQKPNVVKDIIKFQTVLASLFAVFLLKGNMSVFRFNRPSQITLLTQIDELKHDLDAYEKHITHSEGVVKSLAQSTDEMMSRFNDEERKIMVQSETTHRDIAEASEDGNDASRLDHEAMVRVSKDIQESNSRADLEHQENSLLRRQIGEKMEEFRRNSIDVPDHILQSLSSGQ